MLIGVLLVGAKIVFAVRFIMIGKSGYLQKHYLNKMTTIITTKM